MILKNEINELIESLRILKSVTELFTQRIRENFEHLEAPQTLKNEIKN